MEKIWIKKELYNLRYDFLKFLCLFPNLMWFYIWFLEVFSIKKREKKEFTNLQADVASGSWRGARGGRRDARDQLGLRRGTEATWQRPGGPLRRRTGGAKWQGDTWAPVWGATYSFGNRGNRDN